MAKKQDKISRTEPAAVTGGNAAPAGTTTAASEQEVPLPLSAVETAPETAEQTDQTPVVEPLKTEAEIESLRQDAVALMEATKPLRTDGPTLEEYVKAGYAAENYPPQGYAPRVEPLRVPVRNIFGQPVIQHTGGIGHGNAR